MFTVDTEKFYVISVCMNPARYNTRYNLFKRFEQHMFDVGAQLITCEIAFGNRPFILTKRGHKFDFQLRTDQEIWHKENAINLTIAYLNQIDPDWKYVAWIDGDIHFQRGDIIMETVHQLQHYDIVQMFSHITDLGPNYEPLQTYNGFVWSYHKNDFRAPIGVGFTPKKVVSEPTGYLSLYPSYPSYPNYPIESKYRNIYKESPDVPKENWVRGSFWHCGYAWAATRHALNKISLFDIGVLGASDHHMAMGLIGEVERSVPGNISSGYRQACLNWQRIAELGIRRNIGYVPGLISHYWHGKKSDRRYVDRWKILVENKFDPNVDISRDTQGLYRLNYHDGARQMRLRDQIREYFKERNEDSVDLEE